MIKVYDKRRDAAVKISPHFTVREFANTSGNVVFVDTELVDLLEDIRKACGKAVIVNSGFRSEAHNKKVSGAPYSQHLYGRAADIRVPGVPVENLHQICLKLLRGQGGCGKYSTFVHVDVRETPSRW